MKKKYPNVVIFGRTNVGKSTLFNKLTEKDSALISNIEGTTRDSNNGLVEWQGYVFNLIDTGGIIDIEYLNRKKTKTDDIEARVQLQAKKYIKKADLILFLTDARSGLMPQDKQMAAIIKKIAPSKTKIILAVNKADNPRLRHDIASFHRLNIDNPIAISASNGSGTGDLLDIIIKKLKTKLVHFSSEKKDKPTVKICLIGKPNVGKSSLINKLLGEEKMIISDIPHTTREPQNIQVKHDGKIIEFIDTAGMSRSGHRDSFKRKGFKYKKTDKKHLEKLSIEKTLKALNKSDIALFMFSANEDLTREDLKIIEEIVIRKKSLIMVCNKWDLIKEKDPKNFSKIIYSKIPFAPWAPIKFISALTGNKVKNLLKLILEVNDSRHIEITENQLSKLLSKSIKAHKPAKGKGVKHPHIFSLKQIEFGPPVFIVKIGAKDNLHFSYTRFLANKIREKYGYPGTPIHIKVIKNKLVHGKHNN